MSARRLGAPRPTTGPNRLQHVLAAGARHFAPVGVAVELKRKLYANPCRPEQKRDEENAFYELRILLRRLDVLYPSPPAPPATVENPYPKREYTPKSHAAVFHYTDHQDTLTAMQYPESAVFKRMKAAYDFEKEKMKELKDARVREIIAAYEGEQAWLDELVDDSVPAGGKGNYLIATTRRVKLGRCNDPVPPDVAAAYALRDAERERHSFPPLLELPL